MIFFGHKFIDSPSFYHINSIDSLQHTPPSSTVYLEYSKENLDIIKYLQINSIYMALKISTVTELVYASALGAKYIIVSKDLATTSQKIAENYLFDAKILVMIEDEKDIEDLAISGIDGVIYSNAIIKINS